MRRQRNLLGPQGMGGMVSLWGQSSIVKSVQQSSLALAGTGSATATIAAVDTANSVLVYGGTKDDAVGPNPSAFQTRITLTNSTTVTATGQPGAFNNTVTCTVIEYMPGVVRLVQYGTISVVTSTTATITAVNTLKSFVAFLGSQTGTGNDATFPTVTLTNSTTVTGANFGYTTTVNFIVVEFF